MSMAMRGLLLPLLVLPLAFAQMKEAPFHTHNQGNSGLGMDFDSMSRFDIGKKASRVNQVAAGFFLGGSSIKDMNGVYKRVKWVNNAIEHEVMGAYRKYDYGKEDDGHGWVIAYIKSPKPGSGIEPVDPGSPTEWVIIDPSNHDRFGHLGETRTPLSGRNWKHLHRKTSPQTQGTNEVMAPDDERELPWQLVFIGSPQTVEERRKEHLQHKAEQEAAFGRDWSTVQGGMGNAEEDKNGGIEAVPDAETAFEEKRFYDAAEAYGREMAKGCGDACEKGGVDEYWWAAVMKVRRSECMRRARKFEQAIDEAAGAIGIYPMYAKAWLQVSLAFLDAGMPQHAVAGLQKLHGIDAKWPDIDRLLITGYAALERAHEQGGVGQPGDVSLVAAAGRVGLTDLPGRGGGDGKGVMFRGHYQVLGLPVTEATHEDIIEASLAAKAKPDLEKEASAAADTLSDPEKRIMYDDGHDLQVHVLEDGSLAPSISDRVLRTFFPQLFEYEPYGPPSETDEMRPQADVPAQKPLLP